MPYENDPTGESKPAPLGRGWHLVQFWGLDKTQRGRVENWLRYRGSRSMPCTYLVELKPAEHAELHRMLSEAVAVKGTAVIYAMCKPCRQKIRRYGLEGRVEEATQDYYLA